MNKVDKFLLGLLAYLVMFFGLWQFIGTEFSHIECIKHNVAKVLFVLPNRIYCVKSISVQRLIRGEQIMITTDYPMPLEIWDGEEVSEPIL